MAVDKKIKYKDQRLTKAQQKKTKPVNQGGGPNYLGKEKTVTVPKKWLSSPDHVVAELAYITPREQKILLDANIYGSLKGRPNKGPNGIMSLQGDLGGYDASPGGPNSGGPSGNRVGETDKNKQRAADIMTGKTNVSSPTGDTVGYGKGPSTFSNITGGIKDYVLGGGLIGMGIRGLGNLFGGPTTSTGNVGPAGIKTDGTYGTVQDAINASRRNEPPREGGDGPGIMQVQPNMLNVAGPVVGDETIDIGDGDTEFVNRFEVSPEARQAQGVAALLEDQAIAEMISKLYT